jgi:large subunit ribosomal protein L15
MAELHDLSPAPGSHRDRKRLGRGPGSGTGKTAGRGGKGQSARTGYKRKRGFEGGQMPLHRRVPKRGFKNFSRLEYQVVNVRDLAALEGDVNPQTLRDAGLVTSMRRPVKVLGDGELTATLSVSAHAFSKSAREKIEGAGGSVTVLAEAAEAEAGEGS